MTLLLIFTEKIIGIKTELLYILTVSVVWYLHLYLYFLSFFSILSLFFTPLTPLFHQISHPITVSSQQHMYMTISSIYKTSKQTTTTKTLLLISYLPVALHYFFPSYRNSLKGWFILSSISLQYLIATLLLPG